MLDRLADALVKQKGLVPFDLLELPERDAFQPDRYRFVGTREYMGSVVTVAIHEADRVEEAGSLAVLGEFSQLIEALLAYAGYIGSTKLGSFGTLLHVFTDGCPAELRSSLVAQKKGSAFKKNYCVSWVVDLQSRRVFGHRGPPFFTYPGRRWIERVVRQEAV